MRMMRLALFTLLGVPLGLAQTVPPKPAFEVAAIKPSTTEPGHSSWHTRNGRLTMDNLTLKEMVMAAHGVKEYQVSGGPNWLTADRYHLEAKAEEKATDEQLMSMLQTLLAERFQLAFHREQKEMTAYVLVVAKSGLKIHPVDGEGSSTNSRNGKLTAKHTSMGKLAEILSRQMGRPVVDETHVAGGFDFTLEWSNDRQQRAAAESGANEGPSIFTALPEQLGLKLETRKVPVEILVVDRAERPSEN
jgi:uncharacterized protein (TIGR03435 family)